MEKEDTLPLEEDMLPLVSNVAEIQQNAETLGAYLQNANSQDGKFAKNLIRRGRCFVIVSSPNGHCFYPSRFMGYVDNSREAHERMGEKDGKDTNREIKAALGEELIKRGNEQWGRWETAYNDFCGRLGIVPYNVPRKYWPPIEQEN
jgi:hypothetical protein